MATLCEHCGEKFTSLAKHWAKSRRCASQYKPKDLDHEMEEEKFRRSHHHNVLRAHVAETLQHFRYDKYVPDNIMEELKPALRKIRKVELDILRAEIEPLLAPGKQQQLSKALSGLEDPFYSLSTAKREKAFARDVQKLPYVQKRVRNLQSPGKSVSSKDMKRHGTVGFSLVDILTRVMQNDRKACADIIAKSDQWKTGDMHEKLADAYRDIDDGENFRFHPHLARKATEAEADVVRIALQLYNDGVTVHRGRCTRMTRPPASVDASHPTRRSTAHMRLCPPPCRSPIRSATPRVSRSTSARTSRSRTWRSACASTWT